MTVSPALKSILGKTGLTDEQLRRAGVSSFNGQQPRPDTFPRRYRAVLSPEIAAAAIISRTKDCVEGCGKYTDIVSLHNPQIVPDEIHGSRLEEAASPLTRVSSRRIAEWEESFSGIWRQNQRELYHRLIEEELRRSGSSQEGA